LSKNDNALEFQHTIKSVNDLTPILEPKAEGADGEPIDPEQDTDKPINPEPDIDEPVVPEQDTNESDSEPVDPVQTIDEPDSEPVDPEQDTDEPTDPEPEPDDEPTDPEPDIEPIPVTLYWAVSYDNGESWSFVLANGEKIPAIDSATQEPTAEPW
jgi:hypothetical protein